MEWEEKYWKMKNKRGFWRKAALFLILAIGAAGTAVYFLMKKVDVTVTGGGGKPTEVVLGHTEEE